MKQSVKVELEQKSIERLKFLSEQLKISQSEMIRELIEGLLISSRHAEKTFRDWWPNKNFGEALKTAVEMGWAARVPFSNLIESFSEKQIEQIFAGVCMKNLNNGIRVVE
jgi:hypothetical protein